jgi:hypothetical protein
MMQQYCVLGAGMLCGISIRGHTTNRIDQTAGTGQARLQSMEPPHVRYRSSTGVSATAREER